MDISRVRGTVVSYRDSSEVTETILGLEGQW